MAVVAAEAETIQLMPEVTELVEPVWPLEEVVAEVKHPGGPVELQRTHRKERKEGTLLITPPQLIGPAVAVEAPPPLHSMLICTFLLKGVTALVLLIRPVPLRAITPRVAGVEV
jgi:hypothetical protein